MVLLRPLTLLILGCLGACAGAPRIVATETDMVTSAAEVASAIAQADVVAFGEVHQTPDVHGIHLELLEKLHEIRPNIVIAMEMFERDVHTKLLEYLTGLCSESEFLAVARPWKNYERDYRPVVEFARNNGLIVLAANAPAELVTKARKQGLAAVAGNPNVAREVTVPEDEGYSAFVESMDGHPGVTPEMMHGYWVAQCVRDDTMAETITDYLKDRLEKGDRPLAVLICGRQHSDYGRGAVQRIKSRMADVDVRVLSAETVDDMASVIYAAPRDLADYVIVAKTPKRPAPKLAKVEMPNDAVHAMPEPAKPVAKPVAEPVPAMPTENPEGLSPAFGFMPGNYQGEGEGVEVGAMREDGPAARAGIEQGDLIVAVNGIATPDVEAYSELLKTLIIGRKATIRVRRESAEVDLQVEIGSRPSR